MSRADDPHELASAARDLLRSDSAATAGLWPRMAAALARQSLELSMNHLWQLRTPGMQWTSIRCQLLCLPTLLGDEELGERAGLAWEALSNAVHHHPYELAPTHGELGTWITTAWDLAEAVDRVLREAAAARSPA